MWWREWWWKCFLYCGSPIKPLRRCLPKFFPVFISIRLQHLNQREHANTVALEAWGDIWTKSIMSYQEQKNKTVIFNAMLSWPFRGEQQLASPDSWIIGLSSEFIQCPWCKSTQSIIYLGENCHIRGLRLIQVYLGMCCPHEKDKQMVFKQHSKRPVNFILSNLSYWQAPWASHEGFLGWERQKEEEPVIFPFPKSQQPLTLYPCSSLPSLQVPVPDTAVAIVTHSWQGSLLQKVEQHLWDNPQCWTTAIDQQSSKSTHNLGLVPHARTVLPSTPGIPSFLPTPITRISFLHGIFPAATKI